VTLDSKERAVLDGMNKFALDTYNGQKAGIAKFLGIAT
jgi:hypothetical protein